MNPMVRQLPWALMTLLALGVAGYALFNLVAPTVRSPFVEDLFAAAPTATSIHLAGGVLAMVTGAFQVNARLRRKYLAAHRWLGRIYVLAVLCSGVAGFFLALDSFGGLVTDFGFGLMALCWLGTTSNALRHIRAGNVQEHRAWMLRSYALTLAGVTLRIYLGLSSAFGVEFEAAYQVIAWLCWVPNLLLVEWFVLSRGLATGEVQRA